MNKIFLSTVAALCMLNQSASAGVFSQDSNKQAVTKVSRYADFAKNEAIINFKDGFSLNRAIKLLKRAVPNVEVKSRYKIVNALYIKVPGLAFDKIKAMFQNSPLSNFIESIDRNYIFQASQKSNDTYYSKLWAIENNGQKVNNKSGTKDADMDIDEAWNISKGSHDVVAAVLDTGVDYSHNDLADNMWSGNSHHGYDFAGDNDGNNDNNPMPDTPYDEKGHYHGTHVAGIIGAVGDNDLGVSGIAQNVQIMAVKVFRPNGYGYSSDILEGLDYVAQQKDNGVNIVSVNASYGGGGGQDGDSTSKAIEKLGEKGIVFCAAAGNDGKDIDNDPTYPASYSAKNIITVAASDQDDKLASFSNYGKKSVDVAAPGTNILSTYPDNQYAYLQGTSMATPYITGLVTLEAALSPDSSADDRIKAIEEGVDVKNALNKIGTSGRANALSTLNKLDSGSEPEPEPDPQNNPPKANDDTADTNENSSVVINVLANDSDPDGDAISIKSLTQPQHGSASVENGKVKYTPESGFSGDDTFNYTIKDTDGATGSATVKVAVKHINHTPVANDDSATTRYEQSVTIDVLSNDSDADGDTLTIQNTTTPKHGSVTIQNSKVKYTPDSGYSGSDNFKYTITDGHGAKATANVSVTVDEEESNNNGGWFGGGLGGWSFF